jgi:hypothetical protein
MQPEAHQHTSPNSKGVRVGVTYELDGENLMKYQEHPAQQIRDGLSYINLPPISISGGHNENPCCLVGHLKSKRFDAT